MNLQNDNFNCELVLKDLISRYGLENMGELVLTEQTGFYNLKGFDVLSNVLYDLNLAKNEIIHLSPLSTLTCLQRLNLAQNNITDIGPLATLVELRSLDLSGNSISDIDALYPLSTMPHLEKLSVYGNPVCNTPGFLLKLFALQPSLMVIDDHYRDLYLHNDTHDFPLSDRQSYEERIASLQSQITRMNEAFDLQERQIARNGHEAAQHTSRVNHNSVISNAVDAKKQERQLESDLMDQFPYYRVLQTTRQKLVQSLVAQSVTEKQLIDHIKATKLERQANNQKIDDLQSQEMIARNKCSAVSVESQSLNRIQKDLQDKLKQVSHAYHIKSTEADQLRTEFNKLKDSLLHWGHDIDRKTLQDTVVIKHIEDSLAAYRVRLEAATQELRHTADKLEINKILLKNDRAQHKRDVRMHQLQLAAQKHEMSLLNSGEKVESLEGSDNNNGPNTTSSAIITSAIDKQILYLSDITLDPQVEGFLTDIFRFLDQTETGTIHITHFLKMMFTSYNTSAALSSLYSVHQSLLESLFSTELSELLHSGAFFRPIAVEMYGLMGGAMFTRFLISLLSVEPTDTNTATSPKFTESSHAVATHGGGFGSNIDPCVVTFGEFVLHLYVDMSPSSRAYQNQLTYIARRVLSDVDISSDNSENNTNNNSSFEDIKRVLLRDESRAILTHRDRVNLFRAGLLGDLQFGTVPLCVAHSAYTTTSNERGVDKVELSSQYKRSDYKSVTTVVSSNTNSGSGTVSLIPPPNIAQLQEDNTRLQHEVNYLLKRLQENTRGLEMRAEKIKAYFEDELKQNDITIHTLDRKKRDLESILETVQTQKHESESLYRTRHEEFTSQIKTLRERNIELETKLTARLDDLQRETQTQLAVSNSQRDEAVEKYDNMAREHLKMAAKVKKMEKDKDTADKGRRDATEQFKSSQRTLAASHDKQAEMAAQHVNRVAELEALWTGERVELMDRLMVGQNELGQCRAEMREVENKLAAALESVEALTQQVQQSQAQAAANDKEASDASSDSQQTITSSGESAPPSMVAGGPQPSSPHVQWSSSSSRTHPAQQAPQFALPSSLLSHHYPPTQPYLAPHNIANILQHQYQLGQKQHPTSVQHTPYQPTLPRWQPPPSQSQPQQQQQQPYSHQQQHQVQTQAGDTRQSTFAAPSVPSPHNKYSLQPPPVSARVEQQYQQQRESKHARSVEAIGSMSDFLESEEFKAAPTDAKREDLAARIARLKQMSDSVR